MSRYGIFLVAVLAPLVVGCATLSPEAARITTIRDGGVMAMMDCQQLGFVSGDAGIWGGSSGLDSAFADAKNKAAKFKAANAILVTSSRMNPTSVVNATVFDCSERKTQKIELTSSVDSLNPIEQNQLSQETFRKARTCQKRGGAWLDDRCVINIE